MAEPDFTIKQGDTAPSIEVQLLDGDDPVDLSNANVGFRMHHQLEDVTVKGTCAIDETDGYVSYIWSDGDTDTIGRYEGEFIIDYDDPTSIDTFDVDETFPSDGYVEIDVTEPVE